MNNKWYKNGWLITASIIILVMIAASCFMPSILTMDAICEKVDLSADSDSRIGDTIGGITAPFIGIGAAFLTFIAFWVQYRFNQNQTNSLRKERFEHNFYELLNLHENITSELVLDIISLHEGPQPTDNIVKHTKGREVFQMLYEEYPFTTDKSFKILLSGQRNEDYKGVKELMEKEESTERFKAYTEIKGVAKLDHYFRQLYRVFRYIDKAKSYLSEQERYEYVGEARSTLSQYELVMLFYNCLSDKGKDKFKPLIEHYAIFKNIRVELLAKAEDKNLYNQGAFKHNIIETSIKNK